MDQAIQFPGVTNAWTMPIKTRTDMLSTGMELAVYPVIYYFWKGWGLRREARLAGRSLEN